jgi:hypothetical protein
VASKQHNSVLAHLVDQLIELQTRRTPNAQLAKPDGMSSTCPSGTTADENGLGCDRWTYAVVRLNGAKSPRMSLTLDASENNRLSPSLRRGAREGDFRNCRILTSHGGRRPSWKCCIHGAAEKCGLGFYFSDTTKKWGPVLALFARAGTVLPRACRLRPDLPDPSGKPAEARDRRDCYTFLNPWPT